MVSGLVVGLALAVPLVIPPVLFVWYVNTGGVMNAIRVARAQRRMKSGATEA